MPVGTDNIIRKLEEQKAKEGKLPQLLEFYQKLLQIQSRVGQRIDMPDPGSFSNTAPKRLEQGKSLVRFDDLALNWPLLRDTFIEVVNLFVEYAEFFDMIPEELTGWTSRQVLTKKMVRDWFKGNKLSSAVVDRNVNQALLKNLIHASFKPFLVSYSTALLNLVNQESWRRSYCPICGGSPDFAFLDTERGARWLVCSRCDTEWLFQRLQCPYCDTTDQNTLSYFTDNEGLYRLYVCEKCKCYLKTIDLRQAKSEIMVPLERLLALDLDRQAQENGYSSYD